MRRKKEPRPEIGQYRVQEIRLRNGDISYQVEQYDWGYEGKYWHSSCSFNSLGKAIGYIRGQQAKEIVNMRVVWP